VDWVVSLGVTLPRGTMDTIAVVLITLVLSYFTLIFGELVPKRLAMKKSEQIAMGLSGIVSGISALFRPIVWFLSVSTNVVLRLCGVDPTEAEDDVNEEEIRMMVDAGSEKGTIDSQEREFIQNVFEFNDINVGDIATHRTDVDILWLEDDDAQWETTIHEARHTRYPICGDTADDIVGVLNTKDYFRLADKSRENVMAEAVYPVYFVPETVTADVLFRNMRKNRNSMAVVLDEYGGMVGIVTLNDLIEELVGELNDEPEDRDDPDPYIEKLDESSWRLVGNVDLGDLEEATGLDLPDEDYDTFTGLIFDTLGEIPSDGEQHLEVELEDLMVVVEKIEGHQIELATVRLKNPAVEDEDKDE